MINPKISIITVTFNAEKVLERTLRSIKKQDYNNIESIIIDGESTDGTLKIVEKYSDVVTKWISEKDNGLYDAMNKGLSMATGDY
ncbi:MAG: glycosyltransferase, partial [Bacteroidales bacterium]|nr:glycosyltransferase [Bacteroidales bacterium]